MTSKEYIKGVIYNLEDILESARRDNCKPVIMEYEEELENYYHVLKDLEILEEIRNTYKVEHKGEHYWLINKYNLYMMSEIEYDDWSRWLENEKCND